MKEVVRKEVTKLLEAGMIYPISGSAWVSPIQVVRKKGGMNRMCIDYRKLNQATRKDHYPFSFMDQMLERLARQAFYYFLDVYSGYNQIVVDPEDQEKTAFTCSFGVFVHRKMPFGLCNALATFQRCMFAIFSDLVEQCIEIFMDDFSVFGSSFKVCLENLNIVLKRCVETNLVLNWEKCHFMVREGIFLGHKVSQ
uniref:Retrovirus-related Pol polyprotein from transposon 17.6 n=1 Tax=Cajanus cajan TaxID=3821 RepID=A0A151RTZ3_CAJCA|nr:Retrovirus-related Pol polyprotein from transposon 17.6 [Cajanus cajan]